jgi:hypothetical protein
MAAQPPGLVAQRPGWPGGAGVGGGDRARCGGVRRLDRVGRASWKVPSLTSISHREGGD